MSLSLNFYLPTDTTKGNLYEMVMKHVWNSKSYETIYEITTYEDFIGLWNFGESMNVLEMFWKAVK